MSDNRSGLCAMVALIGALVIGLAGPAAAAFSDPTAKPIAPGQIVRPDTIEDIAARLQPAIAAERWEDALAISKALAAHPNFPQLNSQRRLATIYLIGVLNLKLERSEAAVAPLVTATGMSGATIGHWISRIDAEFRAGDRDASARSLAQTLRQFPDALEAIDRTYLLQRAISSDLGEAAGFELRATLLDLNWHHPADSNVWIIHIDELMARGEMGQARALVDRVTSPAAVIQLHALYRYDPLFTDLPPLDIDTLLANTLAEERLKVAGPDADMAAYSGLSNTLFVQGKLSEALNTTDAALALPEPEAETDAWSDRTWIMDTRARTLMALGRHSEAATQMQAASARTEGGIVNVSQTINFAWLLLRLDRNAEALELIKDFDRSTAAPFGVMQAVQIQACAATVLGDEALAKTAYDHLTANWRDAPRAAMDALLCRGDIDAAAALMVKRLEDPDLAATAVSELHEYLPTPAPTTFDLRLNTANAAIALRPEVIAARERVGRRLRVPALGGQF